MTDKLTLSDCFKYPKAKVKKISDAEITGTYKNTVIYENIITFVVKYPMLDEMEYEISFCKLILREITQLTDEEIKKCHDITFWNYENTSFAERVILIDGKMERWDCSLLKTQRDLADYLRSINIDIDGFFECGKAVKG